MSELDIDLSAAPEATPEIDIDLSAAPPAPSMGDRLSTLNSYASQFVPGGIDTGVTTRQAIEALGVEKPVAEIGKWLSPQDAIEAAAIGGAAGLGGVAGSVVPGAGTAIGAAAGATATSLLTGQLRKPIDEWWKSNITREAGPEVRPLEERLEEINIPNREEVIEGIAKSFLVTKGVKLIQGGVKTVGTAAARASGPIAALIDEVAGGVGGKMDAYTGAFKSYLSDSIQTLQRSGVFSGSAPLSSRKWFEETALKIQSHINKESDNLDAVLQGEGQSITPQKALQSLEAAYYNLREKFSTAPWINQKGVGTSDTKAFVSKGLERLQDGIDIARDHPEFKANPLKYIATVLKRDMMNAVKWPEAGSKLSGVDEVGNSVLMDISLAIKKASEDMIPSGRGGSNPLRAVNERLHALMELRPWVDKGVVALNQRKTPKLPILAATGGAVAAPLLAAGALQAGGDNPIAKFGFGAAAAVSAAVPAVYGGIKFLHSPKASLAMAQTMRMGEAGGRLVDRVVQTVGSFVVLPRVVRDIADNPELIRQQLGAMLGAGSSVAGYSFADQIADRIYHYRAYGDAGMEKIAHMLADYLVPEQEVPAEDGTMPSQAIDLQLEPNRRGVKTYMKLPSGRAIVASPTEQLDFSNWLRGTTTRENELERTKELTALHKDGTVNPAHFEYDGDDVEPLREMTEPKTTKSALSAAAERVRRPNY